VDKHCVPNATEILAERTDGTADPAFCKFDDKTVRLVKWNRSKEPFHGSKACFNELVASRLAQLIGGPVLRGAVVFVSEELAARDSRAKPGLHFGVTRMEGETIHARRLKSGEQFVVSHYLQEACNQDLLPVAAAFLAWLRVGDHCFLRDDAQDEDNAKCVFLERRSCASSLAERGAEIYWLIDLDAAFGTGRWTAGDPMTESEDARSELLPAVDSNHVLPPYLRGLDPTAVQRELSRLGKLAERDIRACFGCLPADWCSVSATEAAASWAVKRASLLGSRGQLHKRQIIIA
jgi:hypothetical protein